MWKRDKTRKSRKEGAPPPDAGPSGLPNDEGASHLQDPTGSDAIAPPETDEGSGHSPGRGGEEDLPGAARR